MILPVQVTLRGVVDDTLEDFVRQQVAKLERYYYGITSCRVLVELHGRHRYGNLYHVRIELGVPDGELVVKHEPSIHATLQDVEAAKAVKSAERGKLYKHPQTAIRDAFAEMRRILQDYVRKRRGLVKERSEPLPLGTVESLFPDQGYGFLTASDGRQVYFHRNSVLDGHFDRLRIGSRVRFAEEPGEKGPQASTVHLVHPRKQAKAAAGSVVVRRPALRPST
jgi:cold shock CspA family protein/ribosome-associated translation inhibitor RaiA